MSQRSSDLVETYVARALGTGILAIIFLALATGMYFYRGESGSGMALAVVLGVIGLGLFLFAVFSLVKSRTVSAHKLVCPMCNATNGFTDAPNQDVICQECHRKIPIQNGQVMPLKQVSCGSCGESNWYSDRTKSLLCEACGREIAINRDGIGSS